MQTTFIFNDNSNLELTFWDIFPQCSWKLNTNVLYEVTARQWMQKFLWLVLMRFLKKAVLIRVFPVLWLLHTFSVLFFESKDWTRSNKSRPITASCPMMAFSSLPTHPTLQAHQQHLQQLYLASRSQIHGLWWVWHLFWQRSICNILWNWNSPSKSNSIAMRDAAVMDICETNHHPARACIVRRCCQGGPLFLSKWRSFGILHSRRWVVVGWVDVHVRCVCWCSTQISLALTAAILM
jgi:hypothetical protein